MEKDHFEVLLEDIRSQLQVVAEGFLGVCERLDRHDVRFDRLDLRMDRFEGSMVGLETKVDKLETKVDKLETKVDKLETKVDKIDQGQQEIRGMLSDALRVQADHEARLGSIESEVHEHLAEHA